MTTSTIVKAAVYDAGLERSRTAIGQYVKLNLNVQDFNSNLPLVIVDTFGNSINEYDQTLCFSSFIDINDSNRATLTDKAALMKFKAEEQYIPDRSGMDITGDIGSGLTNFGISAAGMAYGALEATSTAGAKAAQDAQYAAINAEANLARNLPDVPNIPLSREQLAQYQANLAATRQQDIKAIQEQPRVPTLDESIKTLTGTAPSTQFGKAREFVNKEFKSPKLQRITDRIHARQSKREAVTKEAISKIKDPKVMDYVKTYGSDLVDAAMDYAENPTSALADIVTESLPHLIIPGAIVKGITKKMLAKKTPEDAAAYIGSEVGKKQLKALATKVGVSYTAITEGLSNGLEAQAKILNTSFEELRKTSEPFNELAIEYGDEKARRILSEEVRTTTTALSAMLGGVSSKLTGAGTASGRSYDADSIIQAGLNIGGEPLEETIQGIGSAVIPNLAVSLHVNKDQDLLEGSSQGGGAGFAAGFGTSALVAAPKSTAKLLGKIGEGVTAAKSTLTTPKVVRQAIKTGNTAAVTNKEAPNYKPENAVKVLTDPKILPKEGEPLDDHANELEGHVDEMQDDVEAEFDKAKAAGTDTGLAEEKLQKVTELREITEALRERQLPQDEEFVRDLLKESISGPKPKGIKEKVKKFIRMFGSNSEAINEAQAEALVDSPHISPEDKDVLKKQIKLRKSMDEVSSDVVEGDTEGRFIGIKQHLSSISSLYPVRIRKVQLSVLKSLRSSLIRILTS